MSRGNLLLQPFLQFFDSSGNPLASGTLTFYITGTTTLLDTYTSSTLVTANPNPVVLDSEGRPANSGTAIDIWLNGAYTIVLKNSAGTTIKSTDGVTSLAQIINVSAVSTNQTLTTADADKIYLVDASGGNKTIALPAAATAGSGFKFIVKKIDTSSNTVTIDPNSSETINNGLTVVLLGDGDSASVICTGTAWEVYSSRGSLLDENGNELLKLTQTTSAVNEITLANAATGTNPSLIVTGGDTNIGLTLTGKGTGSVKLSSGATGTIPTVWFSQGGSVGNLSHECAALSASRTATWPDTNLNFNTAALAVYLAAPQTINASTNTKIQLTAETFDLGSYFDNSVNYRYTPLLAGKYVVHGLVAYSGFTNASVASYIYIYKNGAAIYSMFQDGNAAGSLNGNSLVFAIVSMNGSTDYLELYTSHNDGGAVAISSADFFIYKLPY